MKRNLAAALLSLILCAAAGAAPARAQQRGRPGDRDGGRHDGDRHDGDRRGGDIGGHRDDDGDAGWQVQIGDPASADCETWEFTAQTPSVKTGKLITEGRDCADFPDSTGTMRAYCRPTGKFATRAVTVAIGARSLQAWEKEELKVCLDQYGTATVDTTDMAYDYTVASKDSNPFFGTPSTAFTLTPGAKKASTVSSDDLTVASTAGGALVLADAKADYFKGEKITISVDGMRTPTITPGMSPEDLIKAFLTFKTSQTFDTAATYRLPLTAATRPGQYVLTITFSRQGPLSTDAAASTVATFVLP